MDTRNFESYLQSVHDQQYEGLKKNVEQDYEIWLADLSQLELIKLADEYALTKCIKSLDEVIVDLKANLF